MANVRDTAFVPEILLDAIKAEFKGKKALLGTRAVITNGTLPTGKRGGDTVEIPTFGLLGELEDVAEGIALSLKDVTGSRESSAVARAGKAFEMSKWKEIAEQFADPYAEFARQLREAAMRRWDAALIDKAVASGLPSAQVIDRFNAGTPVKLSWSFMVDGRMSFGDEGADIALAVVHSKVMGDLAKETDGQQRPLLVMPTSEGEPARVAGVPVVMSDRVPVSHNATLTATGTTPPAVTVSGTTKYSDQLRVEITTGGARGTAVFRYSFDGGSNWAESGIVTAATYALLTPNGDASGLTLAFPVGTYATDNVYVGQPKYTTILAKPGSLLLLYNGEPVIEEDRYPLKDTRLGVVNTYYVAHRLAKAGGSFRPGITLLKHN
jgi:hypothetical protein